jgi:K+-transporting ATPase A subunit
MLDMVLTIAQIFSFAILLPVTGFKVWRKLDQRLTYQDLKLAKIEYQLYENGGSSLKDQMNATRYDLIELRTNFLVFKAGAKL